MSTPLRSHALAEPCRAKQILHGRAIVDPADGRERFWVANMNEEHGGELIAIDFHNDTAEIYYWPAGQGSWCVLPLPGERLAISTYFDGKFLLFDLRTKEFTRVVDFPDESYVWDMTIGADGRIYGGTYPDAKLGSFDPDTGEFEDHGSPVADRGDQYLRHVMATPSGDIACVFGFAYPSFWVYRIATKEFVLLWEGKVSPIATVRGHLFVHDNERGLLALAGEDPWPVEELPLPECPVEGGWRGIMRFSTDERMYLTAKGIWCWKPETNELERIFEGHLSGGRIYDASAEGYLLGVFGQDYFVITPGEREAVSRRIPAESRGRALHFLVSDDRGKLWGGPTYGQTVCSYEIATGRIENTGMVVPSSGEVYGAAALDGKLYTASYSNADFAVYDPEKPWDMIHDVNPRRIGSILDHHQCRPTGRMFLAPDGMLYSGWQAEYGRYGGALVRLNPDTDRITVWEDPLGEEPIIALAVDDRYAYLGTNLSANGMPSRHGYGQFGVWSLGEGRIVFHRRMEGMHNVRPIGAMGTPRYAFTPEDDHIHVFDADALAFGDDLQAKTPDGENTGWGEDVAHAPDGALFFSRERWLVRVGPDLSVEVLGPLEHPVKHMTFGSDGKLYYSGGATLYRVEGL